MTIFEAAAIFVILFSLFAPVAILVQTCFLQGKK